MYIYRSNKVERRNMPVLPNCKCDWSFPCVTMMIGSEIFKTNPYGYHPSLLISEGEILWEYAKLVQLVKEVSVENGECYVLFT